MSKTPDWIANAISETDSQFAPKPVDWNAEDRRRAEANAGARTASVKAAVSTHTAQSDAPGLAALDALDTAHAEREAERIARLHPNR